MLNNEMVKEITLASREQCSGCKACENICPTQSISFARIKDSLHDYPVINIDTCIKCHKCESVCAPIHPEKIFKSEPYSEKYYLAYNKDGNQRKQSTSGGAGGALAENALELGYYVVGAAFDDKWHLSHVVSNKEEILPQIRGSKYLLSDTSGVYSKVLELLRADNKVLFFGTPCQIQALLGIVPINNQANLMTCGIICHGVNSPVVWEDFVNHINKKYKGNLASYNFRSKAKGWGKLWIEYQLDNGKRISQQAAKNLFHVWFGWHYIMRESCFHCLFRKKERYSDICIGDFWGIEKVKPNLITKEGVSVVIISSEKGQRFMKSCDKYLHVEKVDDVITPNVLKGYLKTDSDESIQKEILNNKAFAKLYNNKSFEEMMALFPCPSFLDKVKASLKYRLNKYVGL